MARSERAYQPIDYGQYVVYKSTTYHRGVLDQLLQRQDRVVGGSDHIVFSGWKDGSGKPSAKGCRRLVGLRGSERN